MRFLKRNGFEQKFYVVYNGFSFKVICKKKRVSSKGMGPNKNFMLYIIVSVLKLDENKTAFLKKEWVRI